MCQYPQDHQHAYQHARLSDILSPLGHLRRYAASYTSLWSPVITSKSKRRRPDEIGLIGNRMSNNLDVFNSSRIALGHVALDPSYRGELERHLKLEDEKRPQPGGGEVSDGLSAASFRATTILTKCARYRSCPRWWSCLKTIDLTRRSMRRSSQCHFLHRMLPPLASLFLYNGAQYANDHVQQSARNR